MPPTPPVGTLAVLPEAVPIDVTDPRHVLLKQIADAHCLLDLRFETGAEAYQTIIVELVPEAGYLVLDALSPRDGDARAAGEPVVRIRTHLHQLEVNFESRITQRGEEDGEPYYQVPYPVTIDYPQRRREYRVTVPLDKGIEVILRAPGERTITGEVRDLSPSGFSARLVTGDVTLVEPEGARRTTCELNLPNDDRLTTEIEICHIFPGRGRAAPRLGVCFVNLAPRDERRIERYVAELDREQSRLR